MARHILAVDQGTTNSKALLVASDGAVVARGSRSVKTSFPQPGWVEQDPETIWASVQGAIGDCLAAAPGITPAAIGISNQRESFLMWERATGKPLGPCITWQCRRTTPICDAIKAQGAEEWVQAKTGLAIDPLFSASKARWLLDSIPNGQARARSGEICLGSVDSWLIWKFTGGAVHATDASNASRTQLLDLSGESWDERLLALYEIPREALAAIVPSSGVVGVTVAASGLPADIPIAGIAGDSHAAMFAHSFEQGAVKATFGTGSSLMTLASGAKAAEHGLSRTIAWRIGAATTIALEGNIASTGGTMDWFGRFLGGDTAAAAALADEVSDAGGVFLVPAFAGLGAPHWDDQARGLICGMTHGTRAAHVARAVLEAIAYQVMDVIDAMERVRGAPHDALMADGGATRNDVLMQFQADMIGRPVLRNRCAELSAMGAARLAGLAIGLWRLADLRALPEEIDRFEPRMPEVERRARRQGWQDAVSRAKLRPSHIEGQA